MLQVFLILCFYISLAPVAFASDNSSIEGFEPTAKIQGLLISADKMDRDNEREIVNLDGHVQLVYNGEHLKADRAIIFLRAKRIELIGQVSITSTKNTIGGTHITMDYESNTGLIHNGYVQSGPVIFDGSLLQKIGDQEYFVSQAEYTTCSTCPAAWSFSGSSIRAELGGYAYIKNSVLRVGGIPVLWLPYLVVPLKSDRQSGLLSPSVEQSSKGGFSLSIPYFWAISKDKDATYNFQLYQKRGIKHHLEYRYVLNENSAGELNFAQMYDRAFPADDRVSQFANLPSNMNSYNRWYLRYQHLLELPDNTVHRMSLNNASDLQYPTDFNTETRNHGDSAMENRMSWTKNSNYDQWMIDSSFYINMLHPNPLAGNDDAVHRLPEIRYSHSPKQISNSGVYYNLDLNYTNFIRPGKAYDDLSGPVTVDGRLIRYIRNKCGVQGNYENQVGCEIDEDGSYDKNVDLIRAGQRLDIKPTLAYPMSIADGFDIVPKATYRETHYAFSVGEPSNIRRTLRTEISSRASLSRIFGDMEDNQATRWKHEIIPEVTYTSIPLIDHKSHPFFGFTDQKEPPISSKDNISDGDLGSDFGLQFDYNDRIYDRNLLTFAVTNKLIQKRWIDGKPQYRQWGYLKLSQSYDAHAAKSGTSAQPWSDLAASLSVRADQVQAYSTLNYYPYQNVTSASSRVRLSNDMGQFFQLGLTRQYKITPGRPANEDDRIEDFTYATGFVSPYINLMGKFVYDAANTQESSFTKKVKSWAYIAQLKPPGECWFITFTHEQVTGGDTRLRINFDFNFDGVPKAPLPPETLDAFGF